MVIGLWEKIYHHYNDLYLMYRLILFLNCQICNINDLCNSLGKIYSIDANRCQSDVIISAMNHIDRIVNI